MLQAAEEFKEQMGCEPSDEEMMTLVDASESVVRATMQSGRNVISLSQTMTTDPDSGALEDKLVDKSEDNDPFANVAAHELLGIVRSVLSQLSDKESAILRLRFGLFDEEMSREEYAITEEEAEALRRGEPLK
jgi:RNA polymerase primary sigma factor/RNA polymerase nonessential primary-like sigma factor